MYKKFWEHMQEHINSHYLWVVEIWGKPELLL